MKNLFIIFLFAFLPNFIFFIFINLSSYLFFFQNNDISLNYFILPCLTIPPINILTYKAMHDIKQTALNAIQNIKTGNKYFLPITVDNLRADLAVEQFCSLLKFGFPKKAIIYISYDINACKILSNAGAKCTSINIDDVKILKGYKKFLMKVYLLYLQNWWGLDSYTLDSDIIFFDHIEKAFHNNVDIEISSNNDLSYSQEIASKTKRVNSGFGRYLPTSPATEVLLDLWNFASHQSLFRDQYSHEYVYNNWRKFQRSLINGTEVWDKNGTVVTFRMIDPIKVRIGGLSMCRGRKKYWSQVELHSLVTYRMPIAIHFNFQIGDKFYLYKFLGLRMCYTWDQEISNILKKRIMEIKCISLFGCKKCYLNTTYS